METSEAGLNNARVIASAMPIGVFLFWGMTLFLTNGGSRAFAPEALSPNVALLVWAVAAIAGFGAALSFRGRAIGLAGRAHREESGRDETGRVQGLLLIAWALLEGPALLAGVLFLLVAVKEILWLAAAVYAVGVALTFPRRPWLGSTRREAL